MALRICQFVHPKRPAIDYREMWQIERRPLFESGTENGYLVSIQQAWIGWGRPPGLVVLEQDIAIDPRILGELFLAGYEQPRSVHAVPYVLWPKSTGKEHAEWAHGAAGPDGRRVPIPAVRGLPDILPWFGLGCTYLPADLIEAAPDTEQSWDWPVLDTRLSELAQRMNVPCHVTLTPAIHLHW